MTERSEWLRATIRTELDALLDPAARPFDVHAHTGVDIDGTARSHEQHLLDLEWLDARSVVFPLCVTTGYEDENARVVAECAGSADRLVPFARLDPRRSGRADAEDALRAGARGFKLHPRAEAFALDHPDVHEIAAVAAEARAPVLIHAGTGVGAYGPALTDLAGRHPDCPIVLAHAAISDLAWLADALDDHPNVYFDTAWWSPADLIALFALVPPGRILFGSDAPYGGGVELSLAIALRCARAAGVSAEAAALVCGGQLERLLAGEEPVDAGPAAGPPLSAPAPEDARVASYLAAVGGCLLGGGDPSTPLELARLAIGPRAVPAADGSPAPLRELVELVGSGTPDALPALCLALTLVTTAAAEPAVAGRAGTA